MIRLLRTPRWLAFTATALAAIVGFGLLSVWQWHRAEEKQAANAIVLANSAADPSDASTALAADPREWQAVTLSGRFTGDQYLVRNRPLDRRNGFWVMSAFEIADSDHLTWVVRGWTPQTGAARDVIPAPPAPAGVVTRSGYLRTTSEEPLRAGPNIPAGQISETNVSALNEVATSDPAADLVVASDDWYIQAADDHDLKTIPLPHADDVRNISYAGQWLLFVAITICGWWYFLRRESKEDEAALELPKESHGSRSH